MRAHAVSHRPLAEEARRLQAVQGHHLAEGQHCTVLHSTAQHCTALHCTAQHSTAPTHTLHHAALTDSRPTLTPVCCGACTPPFRLPPLVQMAQAAKGKKMPAEVFEQYDRGAWRSRVRLCLLGSQHGVLWLLLSDCYILSLLLLIPSSLHWLLHCIS